ncbi:hypothetical protein LZ554_006344 [Drepanopeziza brunnea f. sp. 'monogermtubi']|nr:hypothetical protein LZ554_006344 [Drepanopeziza brunnea f. sp. 'monogermtubi']
MHSPSFTNHIPHLSSPKHCVVAVRDNEDFNSRSSSREIWTEDYYGAETAEENKNTASAQNQHLHDSTPAYPPASFQFPTSPTHLGVNSRTYRTHKRSLTDLLPAAYSRSPERKGAIKLDIEGELMTNFTGGKEGMSKVADQGRGGLSSWFSGSSAVESDLPSPRSLSSSPTRNTPKVGIKPLGRTNTIGGGGMFNFFTAKSPTKQQHTIQMPAELNDDEFLTLNVTTALFPGGEPNANDPFSPAAFKNLLMNAEGLLLKLQTAYKLRTISLHELSAEKSAMSEEIEEAETRARSLKSQLEDMAHQVSLKDSAIRELATELAAEKQAHAEEKAARHVSERRGKHLSLDTTCEDLGICRRTRNRRSEGESSLEGGESDAESANSIFSRSRSPTLTMSSVSVVDTSSSTPEIMEASVARVVVNPGRDVARPAIQRPKSAFQKVFGGIGQSPLEEVRDQSKGNLWDGIGMGEEGCVNCRGQDSSVAWDAVGLMRAENKGLKERVEGLERAVEEALDACHGIV